MDLSLQYATSANLSARIELHQRFSTNPYGLQRWVFDRLRLEPGMRVLEIACGAGSLWRENRERIPRGVELVLSDFSIGMVRTTRAIVAEAAFVTCALPSLPFASGQFDLAIANHMLYHVDARQQALAEIRRVLRPSGALFATTNGIDHLREIKELLRDLGAPDDVSASFTLENAEEQLRSVFANIERDEYVDSLRVTDADALVRYIASMTPRADEVRPLIERRIAGEGAFQVMKSTGSFIARNG
ncbi:MAG: class I SAM-dependent methyltransferase [Thermoanaerobaculia bacterium]